MLQCCRKNNVDCMDQRDPWINRKRSQVLQGLGPPFRALSVQLQACRCMHIFFTNASMLSMLFSAVLFLD